MLGNFSEEICYKKESNGNYRTEKYNNQNKNGWMNSRVEWR